MKLLVILVVKTIGYLFFNPAFSNPGLPYIKFYSSHDYNAGIQNWHISQDSRGFIYAANNFGLLEFDGTSWRTYPVTNGIKVRHFNFGMDGKINIACQGEFGFFAPDQLGRLQYNSYSQKLPETDRNFEETWKVFHQNGNEYFGTTTKIFVVNDTSISVVTPEQMIENYFQINNQIYLYQPENGLQILENDKIVPIPQSDFFIEKNISAIIPLIQNQLMIVTRYNGVYIMDPFSVRIWQGEYHDILSKSIINAAIRLRNGEFVFGTQNNGIMVFSPQGQMKKHLTKNYGMANRTVICLFEDKQNNLWVGHNNGISCLELGQPFSFFNEQMGLPGTGYAGYQDNEKLYLGTDNGLFSIGNNQLDVPSSIFGLTEKTEGQVYNINKIDGKIVVGHHNGAYVFNTPGNPVITGNSGTWMFLHLKTHPGFIIAGTYSGLDLYKKEADKIIYIKKLDGFDESCRMMEQDDEGNIWMSHGYKGVFKFRLSDDLNSVENVQFYGTNKGLPSNVLISVFRILGDLYFTTEDGIYVYDKIHDHFVRDRFFARFFPKGLSLNFLAQDANRNIYFLGQQESGVLIRDATGEYRKDSNLLNKISDMLNDDLMNITVLQNNLVLFAAKEGFIVYDPNMSIVSGDEVNVLLREISLIAHGDSVIYFGNASTGGKYFSHSKSNKGLELPYSQNSIKFEFSSTFIDGLGKTSYQYFLEGFDASWSEWSGKNEKEFTNLNEGNYNFKIRSKNVYGQMSREAVFEFKILPPWYRSKPVLGAYFILFSAVFIMLIYVMGQKNKKAQEKLKTLQEEELIKKDSELLDIRTKSEQTIEQLRNEKLKADIEYKNKELANSTMHLINKNEFISHVKQNLSTLVKKHPNDLLANDLIKITESIDKNISNDEDWHHFEMHFDRVHGDFSKRFKDRFPNLSPQERRLCAYLRMNMTTKEIANLLNITIRGTEISRYRLRKKLGLSRDTNLTEFILNF